jgi:sulfate permease, SulP family
VSERKRTAGWLGAIGAGTAIGAVEAVLAVAFAALAFNGLVGDFIAHGIALYLGGAAALLAVMALLAGRRGVVGTPQAVSAAVVGLVAMTTSLDAFGGPERSFLTVVLATAIVTVGAGAILVVLGSRGRANLLRFIPMPIVGAFVAGAGWLLIRGGIAISVGEAPFLFPLSALTERDALLKWVPTLVFGVIVLAAYRITKRPIAIPIALVLGFAAFVAGMAISGHTFQDARSYGWLVLGPFDEVMNLEPWTAQALTGADRAAILWQSVSVLAAIFVTVLAAFRDVNGTEDVLDHDLDTNRELRDAGIANIVAGAFGGIPGFHAPRSTAVAHRWHVDARIAGIVAAVVPLSILVAGGAVIEHVPRMVVGGALVFLGLAFVLECVWDQRRVLSRAESVAIVLILVVVILRGFVPGVVVGLVASVVLFAIGYGRVEQIREVAFGRVARSNVDRPPSEREALEHLEDRVQVLRVTGFVFFGSANGLLERIRARVEPGGLRFCVLDLRRVTGVDSSAVASFVKIDGLATSHGVELVLAGPSVPVRAQLARGGVVMEGGVVSFTPDLDHALQRCEDALLAEGPPDADAVVEVRAEMPLGLADYLRREELPEGTILLEQGAPPGDVFVLESGSLTVTTETTAGTRVRLGTIRPGVVVGEIAMYTGVPRMADVMAATPVVVLRLTREALARMELEQPFVAAEVHRWLAETLAERLTDTQRAVGVLIE